MGFAAKISLKNNLVTACQSAAYSVFGPIRGWHAWLGSKLRTVADSSVTSEAQDQRLTYPRDASP
jgi:hypothetical protein